MIRSFINFRFRGNIPSLRATRPIPIFGPKVQRSRLHGLNFWIINAKSAPEMLIVGCFYVVTVGFSTTKLYSKTRAWVFQSAW